MTSLAKLSKSNERGMKSKTKKIDDVEFNFNTLKGYRIIKLGEGNIKLNEKEEINRKYLFDEDEYIYELLYNNLSNLLEDEDMKLVTQEDVDRFYGKEIMKELYKKDLFDEDENICEQVYIEAYNDIYDVN